MYNHPKNQPNFRNMPYFHISPGNVKCMNFINWPEKWGSSARIHCSPFLLYFTGFGNPLKSEKMNIFKLPFLCPCKKKNCVVAKQSICRTWNSQYFLKSKYSTSRIANEALRWNKMDSFLFIFSTFFPKFFRVIYRYNMQNFLQDISFFGEGSWETILDVKTKIFRNISFEKRQIKLAHSEKIISDF